MDLQVAYLILLLLLSGFFSGSEIALISLSEAKIRILMKNENKTAKIIAKLRKNSKRLLITILIGNNIVNITASVLATIWATEKFGNAKIGMVTGILTFFVLIFGEIFPKTFAEQFSLQFSFIVARPILLLTYILFPISWVLEKLMTFLIKLTGGNEEKMTEDEIKTLVNMGAEEGVIEEEESELISKIFDFTDTCASQIMTPRKKIRALDIKTTLKDASSYILEQGFSRIPIVDKNIDRVVGILTITEILKAQINRDSKTPLSKLDLINPIFIPETKFLNDLFKEFQWKHQHMAIVVNEHGSTTGLITLEDILEEIVGEIVDESDEDESMIKKLSSNAWRVDAELEIDELNQFLNTVFNCNIHKTVSFLLLKHFQKIPRKGEDIIINNFHFFIEKMDENRIQSIRVVKLKKSNSS